MSFGYLALTYNINNKDEGMKKIRMKILQSMTLDAIKAMRRGSREAEMEMLGPGFHSHDRVHKSDKVYSRKIKHKRE